MINRAVEVGHGIIESFTFFKSFNCRREQIGLAVETYDFSSVG